MSVDLQVKPWFKMGGSINGSWAVQDYGYSRTGQSSGSGPVDIYSAAKLFHALVFLMMKKAISLPTPVAPPPMSIL